MTEREDRLQSLLTRLEQERDELKLKIGLAKLEGQCRKKSLIVIAKG